MNAVANPERGTAPTSTAANAPRLQADEVEVWQAALDEQPPAVAEFLQTLISSDEAERARRFHFERDRRRFVVGRGILRTILGRHVGRAPRELAFHYGANGKPRLAVGGDAPPVHFNVAHSDGLAVFAVTAGGEVGVDVERVRDLPEWEQIAGRCFPPRELGRLLACPVAQRDEEFFLGWTRQEAVLKALGVGFGGAAPEESAFSVHPLKVPAGFVAALAVPPGVQTTVHRSWHEHRVQFSALSPCGAEAT